MKKEKIKYRSLKEIALEGQKKIIDYHNSTSLRRKILERVKKY